MSAIYRFIERVEKEPCHFCGKQTLKCVHWEVGDLWFKCMECGSTLQQGNVP